MARQTDAYFIRCSPNSPIPGLSSHRKASPTMIITHKGSRLEAIERATARGRGRMTSKSFHALVLAAALLVGGPLVAAPRAQEDGKRMEAAQPDRTYPGGLEIAFEWLYSCPWREGLLVRVSWSRWCIQCHEARDPFGNHSSQRYPKSLWHIL